LNDGNLRFFFYVGSGVWSAVDTANLFLKDNAWHHVAGVKTSNALQVYVDGTLRNTLSNETRPISYTLGPDFWIGKHGNGFFNRYFIGTIEDARVYATPLSSSQIAALYSAGAAIRTDTPATLSTIADGPLTLENGSSSNYIPTRGGKATDPLFPGVTLMRVTDGTYILVAMEPFANTPIRITTSSTRTIPRCFYSVITSCGCRILIRPHKPLMVRGTACTP
jgi:hypothetical protein